MLRRHLEASNQNAQREVWGIFQSGSLQGTDNTIPAFDFEGEKSGRGVQPEDEGEQDGWEWAPSPQGFCQVQREFWDLFPSTKGAPSSSLSEKLHGCLGCLLAYGSASWLWWLEQERPRKAHRLEYLVTLEWHYLEGLRGIALLQKCVTGR